MRTTSTSAAATHPYCGQLIAVNPISSARYQPVVPVTMASVGIRNNVRGVRRKSTAFRARKFNDAQDRTEHEAHEQVDPSPQSRRTHGENSETRDGGLRLRRS